jgi:topoisomerase-4 subunit A
VTKYPIKQIKLKEKGRSTLSAQKIWYDAAIGRLNKDGNGVLLGRFDEKDKIITFYKDGYYELTDFELINRFDADSILLIEKFNPEKPISLVYFDAKTAQYYAKRFLIETQTIKNKFLCIKEGAGNYLQLATSQTEPVIIIKTGKKKSDLLAETIALSENIEITGWKSVGTKIAGNDVKEITLIEDEAEGAENNEAPTLF